jgi:photosystem II stability/assembly factor-like uncharacterized protein
MKKLLFLLPVILILYFSCTKNSSSTQPPPNDSLPSPQPKDNLGVGWKKIALNDTSDFEDIFFVKNTGFVIAADPKIFKSSDGGNTWSQIAVPAGMRSSTYFNIGMGSEMNAIFVGPPNQVVSTRDGGISFTVSTLADNNIADVFFVDSTTAYAAGTNIWKTIDGGINWVKVSSFTKSANYCSLSFLNAQIGWVFRNPDELYKTINGGVDWQSLPAQFDSTNNEAVFFLNPDTGYVSSGKYVERTEDGGISWVNIYGSGSRVTYKDIHFVSDNIGYITDNTGIYKTQNGGNTWTTEVSLVSNPLIELHFTDANHGWACGFKGTILKYSQ